MKANGIPTGPAMMMKALGLDPDVIMQNVEQAKVSASQVMHHFDQRLQAIEAQQTRMLSLLERLAGGVQ